MGYTYFGNGRSWYTDTTAPYTGNGSSQWNATASITQSSHSVYNRNLTTASASGGELVTTGTETATVAASGDADSTYDSQWTATWTWTGSCSGSTSSSGGTYHNVTHDDYNYTYNNTVTYNADGTTTTVTSSNNTVSGTNVGNSTGWRSWSQWSSGCGSGSSSSSSSSSSWSASWSDSYSESVNYPGFYDGAYYGSGSASGGGASGGPLGYIGDAFNGGSSSGFGYGLFGMSGAMPMAMTAEEPSPAATEAETVNENAADSESPLRHASPMWNNRAGLGFAPVATPETGGPSIQIGLDAGGNLSSITDAMGNRASYTYGVAGNVTSVIDPNGDTTSFGYDSDRRLTEVIDALENQTVFTYDEEGQLAGEQIVVDDVVLTRSYDYDEPGNRVQKVDRNGRVLIYGYDHEGRVTQEIWYDSLTDADADQNRQNTITWTYDAQGNLLSVVDDYSSYTYDYDGSGRLISETVAAVGAPITVLTVGYGTRQDDLPTSMSATVDGTADFLTTYEYDTLDRVVGIRQTDQGENAAAVKVADKYVTFAYADSGALETVTRYASLDADEMVAVSQYTYDGFGRLVGLDHFQDPLDPLAQYTWTYEGGGPADINSPDSQSASPFGSGFGLDSLLSSTSSQMSVNPLPDHVWTFDAAFTGQLAQMTSSDGVSDYAYDARGQLTAATYDYQSDESYSYDANGNRTLPGYTTGDHNRLLSDGTYNYEYDAEGNRTKRTNVATGEVTEYEWDHRNRLVEVTDRAHNGGPIVQSVEYVYDSQNRWIAKSLDPDGPGPEQSTETHFVYHDNQIILQVNDAAVTNRYLWGPAVDQILADEQIEPDGTSEILWPLTDHLNTVRDLAVYNPETNLTTIANHLVYDAFGQVTSQTDPTVTSLFGFTARPFDADTGLQNNLNRWYNAEIGRWLSEDPIGFQAADANLYRYVGNQATALADPVGLAAKVVIYINLKNAPRNFNLAAVSDLIKDAFRYAGSQVKVTVIAVQNRPADVGRTFDRTLWISNYPWKTIKGGPLGWILGAANLPWYYATRNAEYHLHYVRFSPSGVGIAQGVAVSAVIHSQQAQNAELYLGALGKQPDWNVTYANVILHEVFWHGILGHGRGFTTMHEGAPGTFGSSTGHSTVLYDLTPFIDDIVDELE